MRNIIKPSERVSKLVLGQLLFPRLAAIWKAMQTHCAVIILLLLLLISKRLANGCLGGCRRRRPECVRIS